MEIYNHFIHPPLIIFIALSQSLSHERPVFIVCEEAKEKRRERRTNAQQQQQQL
jgi:hypothetical protein